jgi:hypothetical protein|tara:strand:+ start:592 stop:909 length:318 start_codon:yes stop_codon:yes gene_type:complete
MLKNKFKPKCLNLEAPIAYSAEGYLIPCCWCDRTGGTSLKKREYQPFYEASLHIDNNESIEDILMSDTWLEFYNMLKHQPNEAPQHCHRKCTTGTKFCGTSRDII